MDQKFLHSIEQVWRQSLIREMLKKKNEEIQKNNQIDENKIRLFYDLLYFEYKIRHLELNTLNIKISDHFDEAAINAFIKHHEKWITGDSDWNWVDLTDVFPKARMRIFHSGDLPKAFALSMDNKTHIFYIKEKKINNLDNYDEMKNELLSQLIDEKSKTALVEWIQTLKSDSSLEINSELLSDIQFNDP